MKTKKGGRNMASPKRKRSAVVRIAGEKRVANDREKSLQENI